MSLHLLMALTLPAAAGEVERGVQLALFPEGLEFAERQLAGLDFDIQKDEIVSVYDCYDPIGVENLNLEIPIEQVYLDAKPGSLEVVVEFGRLYGEDMYIYGVSGWFDTCIDFGADLEYIEFTDAWLEMQLVPYVEDGALGLAVSGTPSLIGDLDTDISWFPDDLVLAWFEESIIDTVAESISGAIPELAGGYLADALVGNEYGDFTIDVSLDEAEITTDGLSMSATPAVAWSGDDGCPDAGRSGGDPGESPALDLAPKGGASFAIAVTEGMLNELFQTAWRDGYFCFTEENIATVLALVEDVFDPGVADLAGTAEIGAAPRIAIDEAGVGVTLGEVSLEVTGKFEGEETSLLSMAGDLSGRVEPGLDQDIASFTLSLRELVVAFSDLQADHLLSDSADAEANLQRFVEDWIAGWAASQTDGFVLFDTLYSLWDVILKVDSLEYADGGLLLYASLYNSDDPEVDQVPPAVSVAVQDITTSSAKLVFTGTDDRDEPLAYSYQIDSGGWSSWSSAESVELTELVPGDYNVEVTARDAWLNVAESAGAASFTIPEVAPEEEEAGGCGCASGAGSAMGAWWLIALVGWRRRG